MVFKKDYKASVEGARNRVNELIAAHKEEIIDAKNPVTLQQTTAGLQVPVVMEHHGEMKVFGKEVETKVETMMEEVSRGIFEADRLTHRRVSDGRDPLYVRRSEK